MKKMLLLFLALVTATSAFAIIDPDPNSMGMYFDMDAEINCVTDAAPFSTHSLYLVVTNPTFDLLYGFEMGYEITGEAMVLSLVFFNHTVPCFPYSNNLIVPFGEPTVAQPITFLIEFSIMYLEPDGGPIEFFMHGTEPSSLDPAYPTLLLADGELVSIGMSTVDGPVARINGECVVATDHYSFDGIKSLYR